MPLKRKEIDLCLIMGWWHVQYYYLLFLWHSGANQHWGFGVNGSNTILIIYNHVTHCLSIFYSPVLAFTLCWRFTQILLAISAEPSSINDLQSWNSCSAYKQPQWLSWKSSSYHIQSVTDCSQKCHHLAGPASSQCHHPAGLTTYWCHYLAGPAPNQCHHPAGLTSYWCHHLAGPAPSQCHHPGGSIPNQYQQQAGVERLNSYQCCTWTTQIRLLINSMGSPIFLRLGLLLVHNIAIIISYVQTVIIYVSVCSRFQHDFKRLVLLCRLKCLQNILRRHDYTRGDRKWVQFLF